jgi:SAM-dependent methyltransferase
MTPIEQATVDNYGIVSTRFDRSRYAIWPGVKEFLDSLPSQTKILEIGCGNGKNMIYRLDLQFTGIDPCEELLAICKLKGLNVNYGIATALEIDDDSYSASLSVAVIHHLSTHYRRLHAVNEMIRITSPGGKVFIQVWSTDDEKYKKYATNNSQDALIPFTTNEGAVVMRFYHFFTHHEFEELINNASHNGKKLEGTISKEKNNLRFWGSCALPQTPLAAGLVLELELEI